MRFEPIGEMKTAALHGVESEDDGDSGARLRQRMGDRRGIVPIDSAHAGAKRGEAGAEISRQSLSSQRARALLGWNARYPLPQGLTETVNWYRAFLDGGRGA